MKVKPILLFLAILSFISKSNAFPITTEERLTLYGNSGTQLSLYEKCVNEIVILGLTDNNFDMYRIEATNCDSLIQNDVIKEDLTHHGCLRIMPNSSEEELSLIIWNKKNEKVLEYSFLVKPVPLPSIYSSGIGGGHVSRFGEDVYKGEKMNTSLKYLNHRLILDCKPTELFRNNMPKDARFLVTEWKVSLLRGERFIASIMCNHHSKGDIQLTKMIDYYAIPNDILLIEIVSLKRMNGFNQVSDFFLPENVSWEVLIEE
jgi:hypothetical protein